MWMSPPQRADTTGTVSDGRALPSVHVPLPVVGHPAIRAAAHHRVRHAALSQSAGGQRETQRLIQHDTVKPTLTGPNSGAFIN